MDASGSKLLLARKRFGFRLQNGAHNTSDCMLVSARDERAWLVSLKAERATYRARHYSKR